MDGKENKSFARSLYEICDSVSTSVFFDEFSQFLENIVVSRGPCYLRRLQPSFRWPP